MKYINKSTFKNMVQKELIDDANQIFMISESILFKKYDKKILGVIDDDNTFVLTTEFVTNLPFDYKRCLLKYEDEDNKTIDNFGFITIGDMKFTDYTIAPYYAEHIGVYNPYGTERYGEIVLNSKIKVNFGKRLYRFGVLSDIHYEGEEEDKLTPSGGYPPSEAASHAESDFENAITYLNNKEDVNFVCMCGDLGHELNNGTTSDWDKYKNCITNHITTTPVYTTKGNHDCCSGFDVQTWFNYTFPEINKTNIVYYQTDTVSGYTTDQTKAISNHFFFIKENDVFLFGSNDDEYGISTNNKNWICNIYEKMIKDGKRVFYFMHIPFYSKAGNIYPEGKDIYSYITLSYLDGNYRNDRVKHNYETFNKLNDKYKNAVWFAGHTHFKLECQKYANYANICNIDVNSGNCETAWNVHVPSCAYPRYVMAHSSNGIDLPYNESGYHYNALKSSEGLIVDVYENYVDVRGVNFKDISRIDMSDDSLYLKKSNFKVKENVSLNDISDLNDNYVSIKISKSGKFYIKNSSWNEAITPSDTAGKFVLENLIVIDNNGDDVTKQYLDDDTITRKIGFWTGDNSNASSSFNTDCDLFFDSSNGAQFLINIGDTLNTRFNFPLTLKMKGKLKFFKDDYSLTRYSYMPIANYRLKQNK